MQSGTNQNGFPAPPSTSPMLGYSCNNRHEWSLSSFCGKDFAQCRKLMTPTLCPCDKGNQVPMVNPKNKPMGFPNRETPGEGSGCHLSCSHMQRGSDSPYALITHNVRTLMWDLLMKRKNHSMAVPGILVFSGILSLSTFLIVITRPVLEKRKPLSSCMLVK